MDKLCQALDDLHQQVKDKEQQTRRKKAARGANAKRGLQFEMGDLVMVMVAAWGNSAHIKRGSKLCPGWQDP